MNIKKLSLWIAIIMVACFLVAATIYMFRGFSGTFLGSGSSNGEQKSVDTEKTFSADGIKNIIIETVSEDIKVIPSDSGDVKIHYYGNVTGSMTIPELSAVQNGGSLNVELIHKVVIGMNIGSSNLKLDIYVPRGYVGSIDIDTVSAGLDIQGLKLDTLNYHSVSGDLRSDGIDTKRTLMDTTSGKMSIRSFTGDLEFKAVSGDMDVVYSEFNNNVKMGTVSGEMRLDLPDNSQFNIDFSSTSGDFNSAIPVTTNGTNDKHRFHGSAGSSSNNIKANSVSGDFEIR